VNAIVQPYRLQLRTKQQVDAVYLLHHETTTGQEPTR